MNIDNIYLVTIRFR